MTLSRRKKGLIYAFIILLITSLTSAVWALIIRFNPAYNLLYSQKNLINQIIILTVFLAGAGTFLIAYFRKSLSPEIFFYIIFLFSISFENLRIFILQFRLLDYPLSFEMVFSKIIYGARAFAFFSLFSASLFCTGFEARRMSGILAVILFISVFFGLNIILLTDKTSGYFIIPPGYHKEIYFFFAIILLFSLINYIFAINHTGLKDYLLLGLATAVSAAGCIMLFFPESIVLFLLGLSALTLGTVLYSVKVHSLYLWT